MKPSGGNETSAAVLWGISWREYREPFGHENVTRSFGTAIGVSQVGPNAVESTSVDSFGRVLSRSVSIAIGDAMGICSGVDPSYCMRFSVAMRLPRWFGRYRVPSRGVVGGKLVETHEPESHSTGSSSGSDDDASSRNPGRCRS